MSKNHDWSYEEVEYCAEEIFKSFVINRDYDYEILLDKLYIHFDMKIQKGSLKMFFSNQKGLFIENKIHNTLMISPLSNSSLSHRVAFKKLIEKYKELINEQ